MNQTHSRSEIISKRFAMIFSLLVIVICLVVFIGNINGWVFFTRHSFHYVPMAQSSVLLFFILSACLLFSVSFDTAKIVRQIAIASIIIIICSLSILFLIQLLSVLAGWNRIYYKIFITGPLVYFGILSIVTVVLFLLISFALLFLQSSKMLYKNLSLLLTLTVLVVSFSLVLGYGFNAPFFYFQGFIPPSFFSVLSFLFLSASDLFVIDLSSVLVGSF